MDFWDLVWIQERVGGTAERGADIEGEDEFSGGTVVRCVGHLGTGNGSAVVNHLRVEPYMYFLGPCPTFLRSREKTPHFFFLESNLSNKSTNARTIGPENVSHAM